MQQKKLMGQIKSLAKALTLIKNVRDLIQIILLMLEQVGWLD